MEFRNHSLTGYKLCLLRDFGREAADKIVERNAPQAFLAAPPAGAGARRKLLIAHDKHVWDLLHLGFTNLEANLLAAVVNLHAGAGNHQFFFELLGPFRMPVGDREQFDLNRSQPRREGSAILRSEERR